MKQKIKNHLSLTLVICLLLTAFSSTTVYANEIMPLANNYYKASINTTVNSNGVLTIDYTLLGHNGTTSKIVVTTYFEQKQLGLFWERVDTGSPNDEWVVTVFNHTYDTSRTFSLPENGTYRTTVIYEVYGTDGSVETVTKQKTVTY